jgi:hypothetical protein
LPEVSWLFFKAVRAGLAVKHPYLSHLIFKEEPAIGFEPMTC